MAQTHEGAMKALALKTGNSLEELNNKMDSGLKWCWKCRLWKPRSEFTIERCRYDGRRTTCGTCSRVQQKKTMIPMESISAVQKGHDAIRWAIKRGELKPPTDFICKCGKRAMHYHHYRGYRGHEMDVIALCFSCHRRIHCGETIN